MYVGHLGLVTMSLHETIHWIVKSKIISSHCHLLLCTHCNPIKAFIKWNMLLVCSDHIYSSKWINLLFHQVINWCHELWNSLSRILTEVIRFICLQVEIQNLVNTECHLGEDGKRTVKCGWVLPSHDNFSLCFTGDGIYAILMVIRAHSFEKD